MDKRELVVDREFLLREIKRIKNIKENVRNRKLVDNYIKEMKELWESKYKGLGNNNT